MKNIKKLNTNKVTSRELSIIYSKMGYTTKEVVASDRVFLELSNKYKEVVYLVYLHLDQDVLNIDDIKDILDDAKSISCNPSNYIIISPKGYTNKGNTLDDKFDIYEIQKINVKLEDNSYIEELVSMYNNDTLDEHIDLFAHNKLAYESIRESFLNNKKVCVSHATGTGKTILISKCINDFKDGRVLILSSSNYILDYFNSYNQVNSNNVKLMTYSKLSLLKKEDFIELENFNPNLIVLDEYHRCGAPHWNRGVNELLSLLPDSYVLGTSATPVRYLDGARDMSVELFDKNVVSNISLYDAIARRILPMPKYIVALFDFIEKIEDLEDKIDNSTNSLAEKRELKKKIAALRNRNDSSEYIENVISKHITNERNFVIFCKDIEHMNIMMPIVEKWFLNISKEKVPVNTYSIYTGHTNPRKELTRYLNNIENDSESFNLLFSIDMLNEGVHATGIDGAILLRPTCSGNVYYQQIGRAMHANSSNNPLIFDFVNNSKSIQTTTFLDSVKKSISKLPKEITRNYNFSIDYVIGNIYDETKDTLKMFQEIEDSLLYTWDYFYTKLYNHHKEYGHLIVKKEDDPKLYYWITRCRRRKKANKLDEDKVRQLDALGFIWESHQLKWEQKYQELKSFKNKFGHINVSKKDDVSLFLWIRSQRAARNNNTLSSYKIEKLNLLGFVWNMYDAAWDNNYEILSIIKEEYGYVDSDVVYNYENPDNDLIDDKFKSWFRKQRHAFVKGTMPEDRFKKFKALGVISKTRDDEVKLTWESNIKKLKEFIKLNGDANVPAGYKDKKLRIWVRNLRAKYPHNISEDKIKELNDLGFIWHVDEHYWNKSFKIFKENLELNNGSYDFLKEKEFEEIKVWVGNQRRSFNSGKLAQYKMDLLNSLDFVWNPKDVIWYNSYRKIKAYVLEYGCEHLPNKKTHCDLNAWLYRQKKLFKQSKLDDDKVKLLLELGYSLD